MYSLVTAETNDKPADPPIGASHLEDRLIGDQYTFWTYLPLIQHRGHRNLPYGPKAVIPIKSIDVRDIGFGSEH